MNNSSLGNLRKFVRCGLCIHFEECKKPQVKNVSAETNYCQFPFPGNFEKKVNILKKGIEKVLR